MPSFKIKPVIFFIVFLIVAGGAGFLYNTRHKTNKPSTKETNQEKTNTPQTAPFNQNAPQTPKPTQPQEPSTPHSPQTPPEQNAPLVLLREDFDQDSFTQNFLSNVQESSIVKNGNNNALQLKDNQEEGYLESKQYFFPRDLEIDFRFNLSKGGLLVEFNRNMDYSTYALRLETESIALKKSQKWGEEKDIGEKEFDLQKNRWQSLKIKKENNLIQVFINNERLIEYQDSDPLKPGKLYFEIAPDSEISLDQITVTDIKKETITDYKIIIDPSQETIESPTKRCATLWTEDNGTVDFSPNSYKEKKLQETSFEFLRIRAIGDWGWLGGGVKVSKNNQNKLEIDFTNLDKTVDKIISLGKAPYMRLGWEMPPDLADPKCVAQKIKECTRGDSSTSSQEYQECLAMIAYSSNSYATNSYATCPPENYADWEELVYQIVKHYNIDKQSNIKNWVVWNEPNIEEYGGNKESDIRNIDHYLSLYEASVKGALRADPSIQIGGPTVAEACSEGPIFQESCFWGESIANNQSQVFLKELLNFCAQKNLRLDSLVFHKYNFEHPRYFFSMVNEIRALAHSYGLNPKIFLDEWALWQNDGSSGLSGSKEFSYLVAAIQYQEMAKLDMSCFTAFDTIVQADSINKSYLAFELLSKLGSKRMTASINGQPHISPDHSLGILASPKNQGLQALVWRYDNLPLIQKTVTLQIDDQKKLLFQNKDIVADIYLIDKKHSNNNEIEKISSVSLSSTNNQIKIPLDDSSLLFYDIHP